MVLPGWYWAAMIASPMDMYQMAVMLAFGIKEVLQFRIESPWFITPTLIALVQMLWIEISLVLAYFFFEKRDI